MAAVLIAAVATVTAFASVLTDSGDCHSSSQCAARDVVLGFAVLGGWAAVVLALVARWLLGRTWPATVAVVVAVASLLAMPVYARYRNGFAGATAAGRERIHRAALRQIVDVVDGTVRAVRPHDTPDVRLTPGSREGNDTGTCERTYYSVRLAVEPARQQELAHAVAAYWRSIGLDAEVSGGFVHAERGDVRFYSSAVVSDRAARDIGGSGPCLP